MDQSLNKREQRMTLPQERILRHLASGAEMFIIAPGGPGQTRKGYCRPFLECSTVSCVALSLTPLVERILKPAAIRPVGMYRHYRITQAGRDYLDAIDTERGSPPTAAS